MDSPDNPGLLFDEFLKRMDARALAIGDKFEWHGTSPEPYYLKLEFFKSDGSLFVSGEGKTLVEAIADVEKKL